MSTARRSSTPRRRRARLRRHIATNCPKVWKALAAKLELTIDDFIRTTEARHKQVVQAILSRLYAEGFFYKAAYKGFYSVKEETFLTEKDRLPDGSFPASYGEVIELVEENIYFKLRDQQAWLIDYIEKNPGFIQPENRRNEVLGFLKHNELEDLCITRPASRLNWGIPVPFDPNFVTYVWFDALDNYVSVPAAHGDPAVNSFLPIRDCRSSNPHFHCGRRMFM